MNVFSLSNPRPLEISIAKNFDARFERNFEWRQFTNGEWFLRIQPVPKEVFVLGRTEIPGDNLLQTLTLLDTLKRNGAKNITLVVPYFGYCRHDRIVREGDHLPADLFIKLFKRCGATRMITMDLHSPITEKRSLLPLTSLDAIPLLAHELKKSLIKNELITCVAPDHGSRPRANRLRDILDPRAPVCWLEKHRNPATGKVHSHEVLGLKQGTTAIITDDILDTGSTIHECVMRLKETGFKTFYLAVTHPIFSDNAVFRLKKIHFKKIVVTNTVPLTKGVAKQLPITILDSAPVFVRALNTYRS